MPTPKDDPVILTHLILTRADLGGWARENVSAGLTLAHLFAMTPQQVFTTLFVDRRPDRPDDLTALIEANEARGRKGLPPVCPPWIKDILRERTRAPAKPVAAAKPATAEPR